MVDSVLSELPELVMHSAKGSSDGMHVHAAILL